MTRVAAHVASLEPGVSGELGGRKRDSGTLWGRTFALRRLTYMRAAGADSWWSMWLMGLDCELAFTDCTRRAVIGR
ncbi:MAG: hypothetical protein HY047_18335 [Acidobacteria bacterium]|nr:hypothetical protein [Acidobacteriota bacterium]